MVYTRGASPRTRTVSTDLCRGNPPTPYQVFFVYLQFLEMTQREFKHDSVVADPHKLQSQTSPFERSDPNTLHCSPGMWHAFPNIRMHTINSHPTPDVTCRPSGTVHGPETMRFDVGVRHVDVGLCEYMTCGERVQFARLRTQDLVGRCSCPCDWV